jgi:hypothetical protein
MLWNVTTGPWTWLASCEHSNEHSGPRTGRKFLEQLSEYQLLKKTSPPWTQLLLIFYQYATDFFTVLRFGWKNILLKF